MRTFPPHLDARCFCLAAFRSRQAVYSLERALLEKGVPTQIVSTPRAVALGCGLSLRFDEAHLPEAVATQRSLPSHGLIGFYKVTPEANGTRVETLRPA